MTRRRDPERIYQAQRAGVFRRMVDADRVDELDAEHWIASWERWAGAQGLEQGSQGFWDHGWTWINEQRAGRRRPPSAS